MSIAKTVVTGTIYREPETGYSSNNVAVSSFVLNIGEREEMFIRVISKRQSLLETVESLKKNEKVLVEGRLQTASEKAQDGTEKRFYEIDASSIEKFGETTSAPSANYGTEEIVKFESDKLIDEEEIPF